MSRPIVDDAMREAIRAEVADWPPLDGSQLSLISRAFAGAVSRDGVDA